MQVMLDDEQWEVNSDTSLGDILAQVSDRAQASHRIVTGLAIDGRRLTDRDLTPSLLMRTAKDVATVQAVSCTIPELVATAREAMKQFALALKNEGEILVRGLRAGRGDLVLLDLWLGKLADYVELAETARENGSEPTDGASVAGALASLIDARAGRDTVRLADVLEYELMPYLDARD